MYSNLTVSLFMMQQRSKHLYLKKTHYQIALSIRKDDKGSVRVKLYWKAAFGIWKWSLGRNGSINAWLMVVCIRGTHKIHACSGCFAEAVSGAASDTQPLLHCHSPSRCACCCSFTWEPTVWSCTWLRLSRVLTPQTEWSRRANQAAAQAIGWQSDR